MKHARCAQRVAHRVEDGGNSERKTKQYNTHVAETSHRARGAVPAHTPNQGGASSWVTRTNTRARSHTHEWEKGREKEKDKTKDEGNTHAEQTEERKVKERP